MYYTNSVGEVFFLGNIQSLTIGQGMSSKDVHLTTLNYPEKSTAIEKVDIKKSGTANQFIAWIMWSLFVEKKRISWPEYLEYREKVLPAMEEANERT